MSKEPERFWSKVAVGEVSECWEWLASKSLGYGRFSIHGKMWQAHRVAWTLTFGPIPEGLHVCHHCDNKGCCNPYHLFLGTDLDNIQDSARKGRMAKKLSIEDVREIRELLEEDNLLLREIAALFGVRGVAIGKIKSGYTWAWLDRLEEEKNGKSNS